MKWQPALALFLFCVTVAAFTRPSATTNSHASGDTWSIVAVDPATGDVGVAAASCVPFAIDAVAALVPGYGAAATQANFNLENRNRVFERLQERQPAQVIVDEVTQSAFDARAGERQYGIVTLDAGSIQAAGYTGAENHAWAGDRQDTEAAVSVQGNLLEGEAVVFDALAAFQAEGDTELGLADRLMRALEAGSAQGGDRRCNENGQRQTASAAFIIIARAGASPYAVSELGVSEAGQPNTPWLYLSVMEPIGGQNPLIALRQEYDEWRAGQLMAMQGLEATATAGQAATPDAGDGRGAGGELALLVATLITLVAMGATIWFIRSQKPQ